MNISEWILILVWISMLLGLGGLAFPLVWRSFGQRLADGGFGVSFIGGIVLTGWLSFMTASLRLVGFGWISAAISLGMVGLGSGFVGWRNRKELAQFIRLKKPLLFIELGLFIASVVGWSWVRGFQPDIQGLEKFMDMGFVNAILRSKWMPPIDMWLSGYKINYYYFGHFLTAFLTLLSGIDSAYTYNLMLATVFGLSMLGGFSFVYNFLTGNRQQATGNRQFYFQKSVVIAAMMAAILLNFGGNLHTAWHFLSRQTKPYWYPDATRFIQYTIHEFPMYSHVVADLHGHLIDLPIVLMFLTILIGFIGVATGNKQQATRKYPIIFGFLLGVMSMTNTWDVPIYGLVFAIATVITIYKTNKSWKDRCFSLAAVGAAALAAMVITSFPFHLNFQNIAQGIVWVETRSPWWQLGVLWGGFGTIGLVALIQFSSLAKFARSPSPIAIAPGKPLAPLGVASDGSSLTRKFANFAKLRGGSLSSILPLAMVGVSALLIVIPEFIYVKDIYIKEYHRANTMFKLTYQAFVMLSLVFGITLVSITKKIRNSKFEIRNYIAIAILLLVFGAQMAYPFFAIPSYYNGLKENKGLYGLQWLARQYPDDYKTINWMKKNIPWQQENPAVILEAVGESYTDHARVSAFTGLPAVLGWRVHEWLWRGSFDIPGQRTEEVRTMYEKPTSPEAKKLFERYQVRYVFVGDLERQDYKIDKDGLLGKGKLIFESGTSILLEI